MAADFGSGRVDLAKESDFRLGAIEVRPSTRQIESGGTAETLEPRIMQVLVALARRRGEVVSRDELIETCWDGRIVGDDALNRCISKIRKIGEAHTAFRLEAIPRVGYRMTVAGGAEAAANPSTLPPGEATSEAAGERGEAPTLAVLPFANRSGLSEDEVFADGMVDDVIAALSQGVNARVLASGATAHLRPGVSVDFAAIGRQLGVRYLLEGNVRRTGDRLRVTTQLVEAATGAVLWTGTFERPLSELAALQEDLVVDVAATLEIKLQTLELQRTLKKPADLTAWEAMTRAYAYQRLGDPASLMRAIEEAQRSVSIAPDYAVGHAAIAQTTSVLYLIAMPDDPATVQRIRSHVDLALKLDSEDVMALGFCAQALSYIGHPEEALVHATRALRKTPSLGPSHFVLGVTYCLLNRPADAIRTLDDSDRLMPGWAFLFFLKGWKATAFIRAGQWDEAEAMADEGLALNPEYDTARVVKAMACLRKQRHAEARAVFKPVTTRGLPLEQVLTFNRRIFANCAAQAEILEGIRALWAEVSAV